MAHRLSDLGKLIVKKNPNGGVYFAKESFPMGTTPEHLKGYTAKFADAARACASDTKGLRGMDHVRAMRGCISGKLK